MAKNNDIQFWQGLEASRLTQTPAQGEPLWTTDTKKLYIGDGSTAGGLLQGSEFIFVKITQAAYDALATKDSNTVYLIVG